jgi:hypothetical protein
MIVTTTQRVHVDEVTQSGVATAIQVRDRVAAAGKFLHAAEDKFYVRGVTYGPFRPDDRGNEYRTRERVRADFSPW